MMVYVCFLTFSSNFDDHDYENYDPKEHRLPGRAKFAANQPLPSSITDTPTQQVQLSGSPNVRAGQVDSSTTAPTSSVLRASSNNDTVTSVSQPTTTSSLLQGNSEAQEPPKSQNLIPRSPEASQHRKSTGPAPPPPVRKSSSLTRSNQSSSSSLQELDARSRKTSLPSSAQLEPRSNNTVQRSRSIKLQAAKLQDLLSGKSTQNETDDEDETTSSIRSAAALARAEAQKSSTGSSSPSSRKSTKPSLVVPPVPASKHKGVPQPHELIQGVVAGSQVRSGDVSPSLSQGSINDDLKSRLDQRRKLGAEVASRAVASGVGESKTNTGEEEDSDAKEYKPRLQMIKARVEKRRQEAAQALVNRTNSEDASDTSSNSTFVPGVNRHVDTSPIVIPPLVPPKPHPGHPSSGSNTKGLEGNSSPIPPPLKTEKTGSGGFMDDGVDEEEPPPLPARTPAMFEFEKSSPKKTRKANYTNVSVTSDQKESASAPSPPPTTDTDKKAVSKKNYPRVLLKKLKPEKKDLREKTPEHSTSKTKGKGKDTSSPTVSPTRKTNKSPTSKEHTILRSKSEKDSHKLRPSSGPAVHVRPPRFIEMSKRPLPQIPGGEIGNPEEPPDHTAEDYEHFELGQGIPFYANNPLHNYEGMEYKPLIPLPGRTVAASVHRAHSFNPGDRHRLHDPMANLPNPGRQSFGRSNFDPLPTPQPSQRSTDSDYVDGYVNTELPMQLPTRNRQLPEVPSGIRAQQKPSDIEHSDYDYPDLRQHGFMVHTLPTRRKTASPLAQPGFTSRQWGNDGYPQIQQWSNQAPSKPEGDEMRDRLDSDYVPMSSVFAMDDSYINWETIKDIRTHAGLSEQDRQLLQQRIVPPRAGGPVGAHPLPGYAMDDMYMNIPRGTNLTNREADLARIKQEFQGFVRTAPPRQLATPSTNQPVTSAETSSASHGALGAPPSPRPKPKTRQRAATTATALDDTLPLASVAPGSPHPTAPEQAWRLPPVIQPVVSQQAGQPGMDPSVYQNIDPSSSFPKSFGHHVREGLERRSSEGNMLASKPTAVALPPRNIPRRPQH